ncbi:MAG: hypothetical protein QOH06_1679 [Acidobacteriota bacterium]|jgi:uncharacterized repeat protein (TIGR01451 family)|nr:hypothetical protein [Acidobacteriota bacterium]
MKFFISPVLGISLIALASGVPPASAQAGVTERVSVDSSGAEADNTSDMPAISADGRFVAFASLASNLVPDDTNDSADTFVHDRRTGQTERVSVDNRGRQGDGDSGLVGVAGYPAISADGRFVAFPSDAANLVRGDTNGTTDIFVRDRLTGTTERVSVSGSGGQSDGFSEGPAISADGRFVAFHSGATNLVAGDDNFSDDVFVRDRLNGTTEIVSVNNAGEEGNSLSFRPDISADGRFVVFSSSADNLVPGPQFFHQVFLRDRALAATERVSEDAAGNEGDGTSVLPAVSANGRFVAFETNAANLIGDGSHESHVLVYDRQTGTFERASADSAGNAADALSGQPDITADGRFVTFYSLATNLVAGDTNNRRDIFVRDRQNGAVVRVSVSTSGEEGNSESMWPKISDDGLVSAFQSNADNLVPDDTNSSGDVFVHDRRPAVDLALAMTDTPDPVAKKTALTYTVTVTNGGPGPATQVVLTDTLPAEAAFVSATTAQGSCARGGKGKAGGALTCGLGSLAAGATASVTIVVQPPKAGTLTNTAAVSAAQPDPNRANNSAAETTTVF